MCFDAEAEVPVAPRSGALTSSQRVTLRSSDGTVIAARSARTGRPRAPGIVLLPDVRGLHRYYEALADTIADAGVHAVAIGLYSRTAGPGFRDDGFDHAPHRRVVTDEQLDLDVRAAVAHLRDDGIDRVYVWGFCFGGRISLLQASQSDVEGVIGFYGWPTREGPTGRSPVGDAVERRVRVPVLAVYGGADEKIPADDRDAYDRALAGAGVAHETMVYDGAPHGFFDRSMEAFQQPCSDAWERVLAFAA